MTSRPEIALRQRYSPQLSEPDLYQWTLSGRGFPFSGGDWLRRAEHWVERCTFAASRFGHGVCSARRSLLHLANDAAGLHVPRHPAGRYTTYDDLLSVREPLETLRRLSSSAISTDVRRMAFGPWVELDPVRNVPYVHSGWLLTAPASAHKYTCPIMWIREAWAALGEVFPLPPAPLGAAWDDLNIDLLDDAYDAATNHLTKNWDPNK